jgi:triosephosphate isomerase (TIM)
MSRGIHIFGNWKMNKTRPSARDYFLRFKGLVDCDQPGVAFAVPFTEISVANDCLKETSFTAGAQTVSQHQCGAYTGEISTQMLFDVGAKFTLIGHSERRHVFKEGDDEIFAKVKRAQDDALHLVLCIGETETEREEGHMEEVLERQLTKALALSTIIGIKIAYEPVWAIGTGKVATPEIANEAHAFIRKFIAGKFGEQAAEMTPILYGGSVKPENTKSLIDMPDIDGFLVGGASLAPEPFAEIVNIARKNGS